MHRAMRLANSRLMPHMHIIAARFHAAVMAARSSSGRGPTQNCMADGIAAAQVPGEQRSALSWPPEQRLAPGWLVPERPGGHMIGASSACT